MDIMQNDHSEHDNTIPNHSAFHLDVLAQIIENAVDGIITIQTNGIIISVNKATEKLFSYPKEELLGKNINILMPSAIGQHHNQYIQNYLSTGTKKIIGIGRRVEALNKSGKSFQIWLSISEVKIPEAHYFVGFVHDLTPREQAQRQIQELNSNLEWKVKERTEKLNEAVNKLLEINTALTGEVEKRQMIEKELLESQQELKLLFEKEKETSELKSRFLTMASHEFRTPLSTIISSASLLLRYALTEEQSSREKHIQRIKNAANTLLNILNDFLSISKLEEGNIQPHLEAIDLINFSNHMIDELSGLLKNGQSFQLNYSDGPIILKTDPVILKNIYYNLCSNAIKYSPEQAQINIHIQQHSDQTAIHFKDEGIGIPENEQAQLCTRFFRAKNALNIQGTGVGLAIVKGYCDLIGCELSFISVENQGSTFSITFKNNN